MRDEPVLMNLLCCPACQGELLLQDSADISSDGHIMTGALKCVPCDAIYPILGGVPRFTPRSLANDVSRTVDGFGYEWQHANPLIQNKRMTSAETFLDFIDPVQPDYFRGKTVLDAGCGSGRFTYWAQQWGADAVVGVDLSESVNAAFQNTRSFPNVLIIQADLFSLPLRQSFDYVFSVGVLQFTPDPRRAFDLIVSRLKHGGGVSAWVYGRENNGWIIYLLNPVRRNLTSRLPHKVLLLMSYGIAAPMFLALKGVYGPVGRFRRLAPFRRCLFYFDYLNFLSKFGYHEQTDVIFDHLAPNIADYISHDHFLMWFEEDGLKEDTTSRKRLSNMPTPS